MRHPLLFIASWYAAFWAMAAALHLVIGWGWAMAVALTITSVALTLFVRYGGLEPGETFCFVWRRGYRVRHIHLPRSGYVTCERVKEMYEEDRNDGLV